VPARSLRPAERAGRARRERDAHDGHQDDHSHDPSHSITHAAVPPSPHSPTST
jgi:hypothetical protein